MKVILRQNLETLGKTGDVVEVKNGFALNYLIPRGYAYLASKGNLRAVEVERVSLEKKEQKEISDSQKLAEELEKISINIPVQVGEEDRLFGSVTSQMIADALKEKNFDIDKRKIELEDQIKTLGIFDVNIKLHSKVSAKIKVWVVRE
ncbi:MAG: 50S ribosomal protein L9 [Ignavibacteriales bacterium]|jgi:large subunit ribosomal protein L9|nr:50S ribosomal protein L9 [Ignavibacteriaceae bacterium]NLH60837.1 50S ribosomal protein L9 [Ignavibacteriales bacterium]HOJ18322.1 50S ribosomal protein L9 [Ignavibacteriaceae bacterium]HPO55569.1 50S ribosomal protein L9 [Ignavibacteriaceae bacterium]